MGTALAFGDHRSLEALFAWVDRASARDFATAGGFGDAAVHGHVLQL
jgi:hypothetical protein